VAEDTVRIREAFPLSTVAGLLERLSVPAGKFDASGSWSADYGIFGIFAGPAQSGRLRLHRKAGDAVALRVSVEKRQPDGYIQRVAGRLSCRADELSTPTQWKFEAQLLAPDSKGVAGTRIEKTAVVRDGALLINDGVAEKRIALPRAYTVSWALFDAVGRLPRRAFKPIEFDLIDDFDQFKGGQVLSYRSSQVVAVAGRKVRLHAFDHLGRGILPWVYFVDDRGVLVLAVGGLAAYGLLAAEQAKGGPA
jgi:hypothetical protein